MASFDLWIDGGWGQESVAWSQEVALDLDRFANDQYYADTVDTHIRRALAYLAKEVEEIGTVIREGGPYRADD